MSRARTLLFCFCASATRLSAQDYLITTFAGGAPTPADSDAALVSIGRPAALALDATDRPYFSSGYSIFRLEPGGQLSRIAGNGRFGSSGDGGPAVTAQIMPLGIAVAPSGELYFVDALTTIRKVSRSGVLGAVVSNLPPIGSMAVDQEGSIYFSSFLSNLIQKLSSSGAITTIAGSSASGYSGDGGPARNAQLNTPGNIAIDSAGNLYIGDTGNNRVRRVSPAGIITTIAGNGTYGSTGDGGPATQAAIRGPGPMTVDRSGNVYISELTTGTIRRISSTDGTITTVFSSPAVPATVPGSIAVNSHGDIYYTDSDHSVINRISGSTVTAIAGNRQFSFSGDGGPARQAQLGGPSAVAVDAAGNVLIADTYNSCIRKVSPDGIVTRIAGNGTFGAPGENVVATASALYQPIALALDKAGDIFFTTGNEAKIHKVSADGILTTIAGTSTLGYSGDNGPAAQAQLADPGGLAVDSAGNLYIADGANERVRKISPAGIITTVAGTGAIGSSGVGGPAVAAELSGPSSVAVDTADNLYILDLALNGRILKVDRNGTLTQLAGGDSFGNTPRGRQVYFLNTLAVDNTGVIYFTDSDEYRVRSLSPGGIAHSIAGNRTPGYSGDGGLGTEAQLLNPAGLAVDPTGRVYIADSGDNAIRLLQPLPTANTIVSVTNGASGAAGAISPGEIVVIYGNQLGPEPLAIQPNGISVTFNGVPAQVVYGSTTQVCAVVPASVSGGNADLAVSYLSNTAHATVTTTSSAPGIFTLDVSGTGQAVAFNQDGSINSPANPAAAGGVLFLYGTGLGLSTDAVRIVIAGVMTNPESVAAFTGSTIQGLSEIRVRIPTSTPVGGAVPIQVLAGTAESQSGLTVAVTH